MLLRYLELLVLPSTKSTCVSRTLRKYGPLSGFLIPVPTLCCFPLSQTSLYLACGLLNVSPKTSFHSGEFSLPHQLFHLLGSLKQSWAVSSPVGCMGPIQQQQASDAQAHQLPWHGTGRSYHVASRGKMKGWEANLCSFLCHSLHKRVHFRMSQLHIANTHPLGHPLPSSPQAWSSGT